MVVKVFGIRYWLRLEAEVTVTDSHKTPKIKTFQILMISLYEIIM